MFLEGAKRDARRAEQAEVVSAVGRDDVRAPESVKRGRTRLPTKSALSAKRTDRADKGATARPTYTEGAIDGHDSTPK